MATVHPAGWRALRETGSAQRELETLETLAEGLPDGYTVFHGVHWTRIEHGTSVFGEVDFAVVAPSGRTLLIEQKSGALEEGADGLHKRYATQRKSVPAQIARTLNGLQTRYSAAHGGAKLPLDYILYCPDHTVRNPRAAGIEPQRIVDAGRSAQLVLLVQSIVPEAAPDAALHEAACAFFEGVLQLVPEIGAVAGAARKLYSRISGGLATWARRVEASPFRLRVVGTAGSGKTQLALSILRDCGAAGRRALYVCFNRPLADHLVQLAPRGTEVLTYHQLCDRVARARGVTPDFTSPAVFRELEDGFAGFEPGAAWAFDELVVDEGQDFHPEWVAPLLRLLKAGGRAWWLEDPMQNLYGRAPAELPGWVTLRSDTNYRSPRDLLDELNRLIGLARPVEAASPIGGGGIEILTYAGDAGLLAQTRAGIDACVAKGFRRPMIAVVTFRGRESSALSPFDALGPYRLRAFTGRYDLLGSPVYTDGEVQIDTVFRFKGQSAPAVVFTEVDFDALDDAATRRLFVGATRATMKLVLVVSERAAATLLRRLDAPGA